MSGSDFLKLAVSIIACEGAGFIGSIFTMKSISGWYEELKKPRFTPPDAVFGPVWLTLYLFMGVAVFLVWQQGLSSSAALIAFIVFWIQLALNILWSLLFFGLKSPLAGLFNIILLWLAILVNIILFFPVSAIAGILLLPYILWVSVATYLNAGIWRLNR
jgi:tryptophan-rich sensory protein